MTPAICAATTRVAVSSRLRTESCRRCSSSHPTRMPAATSSRVRSSGSIALKYRTSRGKREWVRPAAVHVRAWENRGMLQRVLSPVLVGRQEELSQLEDALLSANRGDGRFVLLAGEAGIGKTRLATELTRRARKLGCDVLWGSCSEAELALPYLPFVEAVGNRLDEQDPDTVRAALGPTAAELAQLFPQLAEGPPSIPAGDPAQAKLRLFESVVSLLEFWARDRGLLLVLDDVHWADSSTRELLDYAARRLARSRVMLLATYRSDELDRRHPLTRTVQVWRRAGLAETVMVSPMEPSHVAEMIAAILNAEEVSHELARAGRRPRGGQPVR